MSEQEFVEELIPLIIQRSSSSIKSLFRYGCRQWGQEETLELVVDCYEGIYEADNESAVWFDLWFTQNVLKG